MSIQNEISRLEQAKADIAEAIRKRGVEVPKNLSIDGYAAKVEEIAVADVFAGATSSTDGKAGLVPDPKAGDEKKFLQGDGTWGIPDSDTTYDLASDYSDGLMSSDQYTKLKGIASGANKTTVDAALSSSSVNPVQNKIVYAALPWEYSATFYVDSWSTATSDEQAQGFAYRQVVTPVKKISVAPTIAANSMFLGFGSPSDSSVLATKVALTEAANVINGGLVYTGSNSITVLVEEKPTSDVTMTWWLRT